MINIIFFCNWGESSYSLLKKYSLFTKNNQGFLNSIKGVIDINQADYIIFIEGVPKNFNLNILKQKKCICLPREPFKDQNWVNLNLKYGYTYNNIYHVVTYPQFINKNFDFLNSLQYSNKNKLLSAIVSNKNYPLRINFFKNLVKYYPDICDIYGYGWGKELGKSYKGCLGEYHNKNIKNKSNKYDGLEKYKYTICIENVSRKNYFSEKFTDAILSWCIPIYYGCTNISTYFPKDCYYEIDITNENCYNKVKEIIKTPITEKNIKALEAARQLILHKYNIWPTIEHTINSI